MLEPAELLQATLGICAGVALVFRPPVTAARLCTKDKCLEPMFGDVGQARTKAAMLLLPIVTTSSRTYTKPIVVRSFLFLVFKFSNVFSKCFTYNSIYVCPVSTVPIMLNVTIN